MKLIIIQDIEFTGIAYSQIMLIIIMTLQQDQKVIFF